MVMNADTTEGLSASVKVTTESHITCDPDHDGDSVAFRFLFPADSLALRPVDVVDGVPKLCFVASSKAPTITYGYS